MRSHIEIELKMAAPEGPILAGAPLDGFAVDDGGTEALHATYWDTPSLTLTTAGHSMRHRRADGAGVRGGEDGWTLKLASPPGAMAQRREVHLDGPPAGPPAAALDILQGIVGRHRLAPVATITTVRHRILLRGTDGTTLIELVEDEVTSTVRGEAGPSFREIEAELLAGDVAALRSLGKLLRKRGAGTPDPTPKIARVLAGVPAEAATGTGVGADADAVPVTVAELVGWTIGRATRQLLERDPAIRLSAEPDDIHKARVATRRLRSDLRSLGERVDAFRVDGLRRELAWVGAMLGEVRDLDVLTERIGSQSVGLGDDVAATAAAAVRDRLAAQRRAAVHQLHDVMRSSRYLGLLADLQRLADQPPLAAGQDPSASAERAGRHAVSDAVQRVRKRVRRLGRHPSAEALHDLRKAAKRARYAAELVGPISGGRTDRLARRLARLQETLGDNQDAATAHEWLLRAKRDSTDVEEAFLLGRLMEVNRSSAPDLHDVLAAWHRAAAPRSVSWLR